MVESKAAPNWLGPVLGALILIGGYIAYQQWHERSQRDEECAELKRSFTGNMNSMMGPLHDAINESIKQGNQQPMASMSGSVAGNQAVMEMLNAKCPGWIEKQYE